jgi:hypothetical protein
MKVTKALTFKYKGKIYEFTDQWTETCLAESAAFQLQQFNYLVKVGDFDTLTNRINNQIKFGFLKEVSYIK